MKPNDVQVILAAAEKHGPLSRAKAEALAIATAKKAVRENFPAALAALRNEGVIGPKLSRRARVRALQMAGLVLPEGWTIDRVTPDEWKAVER